MPSKNFERVIRFYEHQIPNGDLLYIPLVNATLITQTNNRISLPLLFDTGASVTSLRSDLYPFFGLQSWDQGQAIQTSTASGVINAYQYTGTLEIFGKIINCPIHLMPIPPNPLYLGLLGRDTVFKEFGFGFWESTNELFVTSSP